MSKFKEDRIENEKADPAEASSLRFINVPITLMALFLGFGVSYLALKTDNTNLSPGDSRTVEATPDTNASADPQDLSALMAKGKQVYTTTCQACHQAHGAGIPGVFPPLTESEWVKGPATRIVAILLYGLQGEITVKGQTFKGVMPPLKDQLDTEDLAAVVTYVRNSFGNKADPVTTSVVQSVKELTQDRKSSWNGEAELNSHEWQ